METKLEELQKEIEELKKDRGTKKLSAYGAITTPIVVAVVGGYFALFGQIKNSESRLEQTQSLSENAQKDRWLEQAKFAKGFMNDLLRSDSAKAKMALEIISYADANLGSRLTEIVAQSSESQIRDFAKDKKTELRDILIRQLVHPEKSVRRNAAEGLLAHAKDPFLIPKLIEFAEQNPDAKDAAIGENLRIYNVTAVLLDLAIVGSPFIKSNLSALDKFSEWAVKNDPGTKKLVSKLKAKIDQYNI